MTYNFNRLKPKILIDFYNFPIMPKDESIKDEKHYRGLSRNKICVLIATDGTDKLSPSKPDEVHETAPRIWQGCSSGLADSVLVHLYEPWDFDWWQGEEVTSDGGFDTESDQISGCFRKKSGKMMTYQVTYANQGFYEINTNKIRSPVQIVNIFKWVKGAIKPRKKAIRWYVSPNLYKMCCCNGVNSR